MSITNSSPISKLDFVAVPSRDAATAHRFYVDTLGLRPDPRGQYEVWAGDTCLSIWEPERAGMEFSPQRNAHIALHVDDMEQARADLQARGVEFLGETFDTSVCHMSMFRDPDGNDLMLHQRFASPPEPNGR